MALGTTVAGTAIGAIGGAILKFGSRALKKTFKFFRGTLGKHRDDAAATLVYCAKRYMLSGFKDEKFTASYKVLQLFEEPVAVEARLRMIPGDLKSSQSQSAAAEVAMYYSELFKS